jgi:hypothetical protein
VEAEWDRQGPLPLNKGLAEDRVVCAETGNPGTVGSFHRLGVEESLDGKIGSLLEPLDILGDS